MRSEFSAPVLALLGALLAGAPAGAQDIATMAAAVPDITGTAPGAGPRPLAVGARLVQDERIVTTAAGSGQILFRDQTTLSVAPGSDLVLDRYVYDPEQGVGDFSAALTRGVLRFIGGRISKSGDATIRTPAATIGIRGAIVLVEACTGGDTTCPGGVTVTHLAGQYSRILNPFGTITLSRPSARAVIAPGAAPLYTGLVDAAEISRILAHFNTSGPGAGGAIEAGLDTLRPFASGEIGATARDPVSTSGEASISPDTLGERLEALDAQRVQPALSDAACCLTAPVVAPPVIAPPDPVNPDPVPQPEPEPEPMPEPEPPMMPEDPILPEKPMIPEDPILGEQDTPFDDSPGGGTTGQDAT